MRTWLLLANLMGKMLIEDQEINTPAWHNQDAKTDLTRDCIDRMIWRAMTA